MEMCEKTLENSVIYKVSKETVIKYNKKEKYEFPSRALFHFFIQQMMRKIMRIHAFALSYDCIILTSADNILY